MSYGKMVRQVGIITTIPMIFIAGPLVGYWMGQWLDERFISDPWGKTVMALLGFAASVKQVVGLIRRWIKENEKDQ